MRRAGRVALALWHPERAPIRRQRVADRYQRSGTGHPRDSKAYWGRPAGGARGGPLIATGGLPCGRFRRPGRWHLERLGRACTALYSLRLASWHRARGARAAGGRGCGGPAPWSNWKFTTRPCSTILTMPAVAVEGRRSPAARAVLYSIVMPVQPGATKAAAGCGPVIATGGLPCGRLSAIAGRARANLS
jgi:hypothetical protein